MISDRLMGQVNDLVNRIKKSGDGRVVMSNFGYLTLLQCAGYVFPLITMPYLARVIGASGFGKIAFASAIVLWAQTIADWGFNFTATRDVAQNRENAEIVSRIFSDVLWARVLLTGLSFLILMAVTLLIPFFREDSKVILATFFLIPGHILFPDWFFQAVEKMKYTTIFNLAIKLLFTVAVFLFITSPDDYILQPLLTSAGYVICGIVSLWLILGKWGYKLYAPKWGNTISTIKGSTDVFLNNLMPNLYNSFSIILLGVWGGSVANGLFDGGNKFVNIFNNFQSVLSRAFFPFLSRHTDKHRLFAYINIGSASLGASLLFIFSPLIIRVMLGTEFLQSVDVMRILSVSLIFLSMSNTYGTNYLIIHHKEKPLRNITFISSVFGMLCAIPLVKLYSYIGAALVILICRAMLGTFSWWLACRHMRYKTIR